MAYANISSPNGFQPVNLDNVKSPTRRRRPVAASRSATASGSTAIICVGDAYTLDTSGNAVHAGTNDVVYGIVELIEVNPLATIMNSQGPISQDYLPAADAGSIVGIEDKRVDFEVQTDTFAVTNQGGLFNLTDAAPSTLFRQSRQSLNVAGGAGFQFRAIQLVNRPTDNTIGTNARVLVNLAQALG